MREAQGKQLQIIIEHNENYNLSKIVLLVSVTCKKSRNLNRFLSYSYKLLKIIAKSVKL